MTAQFKPSRRAAQTFTVVLTTAAKMVGLAVAFNELLLQAHPASLALAISALLIAGGQLAEGLILSLMDRPAGPGRERRGD